MSGTINFARHYAKFDPAVRDFEKTPGVIEVLSYVMCLYNYPLTAVIGGKFAAIWLKEGEKAEKKEEDLDLVFELADQPYYEIILRDHYAEPVYGGYLIAGKSVTVTDEIVSGYRVIVVTHEDHSETRHEFVPGIGYEPVFAAGAASLDVSRRRVQRGVN